MKGNSTVISSKNDRIRLERYVTGVLVTRLTFPSIESAVKAYPILWKGDFINLLPFGTVQQNDWGFLSDDMMCEIGNPFHSICISNPTIADSWVKDLFLAAESEKAFHNQYLGEWPKDAEQDSYGDHVIDMDYHAHNNERDKAIFRTLRGSRK